jgi:glycosyltransferase involved in cell wall biosynthesis
MAGRPFISVLTPTYNRRKFIPAIIQCYKNQTYPKDRMEWIIYDDGTDLVGDLFEGLNIPNIRYVSDSEKKLIGAKRNKLMDLAKGDILVWLDDDDFYPPERIQHAVTSLQRQPKVQLAGSSLLYMYYFDTGKIHSFGPIHQQHATNGTMAVRKEYAKTHRYDETVTHAEEKSFLDDYKHPMVQLDAHKTMLVMSHSNNTYDKRTIRDKGQSKLLKETTLKLKDFIRTAAQREFYANLHLLAAAEPAAAAAAEPAAAAAAEPAAAAAAPDN